MSVVRFRLEAPYLVRLLHKQDTKKNNSSLAQLVERRTVNPQVAGSSPAGGATFKAASLDAAFLYLLYTSFLAFPFIYTSFLNISEH